MVRRLATRTTALVAALTMAGVLLASPASADHVGMVARDASRCVLGEWATGPTGPGVRLFTDRATLDIDPTTGDLTVTCQFDVPAHVDAVDTLWGREWNLPARATEFAVGCWAPSYPYEVRSSDRGRFVVTPSGKGLLSCTFLGFAFRTLDPYFRL